MIGFLSELGKQLSERWLRLVMLPGLLFIAVVVAAARLGQARWADFGQLGEELNETSVRLGARAAAAILVVIALLLAAAGAGLAARVVAALMQRAWLGDWPGQGQEIAAWLARRRRERWREADRRYNAACDGNSAEHERDRLATSRNRIALAEPACPTWMGDRIHAAEARVWNEYELDLTSAWPRLWLLLPESTREELRTVRDRFDQATMVAGWGLLYVALGARWWPAAIIGLITYATGWYRGRMAVAVLADLTEATVDLHGRNLAYALGIPTPDDYLTQHVGKQITVRLRKGI